MEELTYTEVNGYLLPNLTVSEETETPLGRFGLKRRDFLMKHRNILYTNLLTQGKLNSHLSEIDQTARERFDMMVSQMAAVQGVTEELKQADQMKWVGLMNNIRHSAEEVITRDLITS